MKHFRYYIISLIEGNVLGTDDSQIALDLSMSDDFFVIDSKDSKYIYCCEEREIKEFLQ